MLLILSASVVLNNRVAPDAFFCYRLYATLVVVVTVIHYDISSVRCAVDTDDAVADIVALNFGAVTLAHFDTWSVYVFNFETQD